MKLSAVVIAKDAENTIGRTVDSLQFSDDIIVIVDAHTTDETSRVARERGARVYVKQWHGYGPQKNFGLHKARGEWVLFVDADEEVSSELAEEILRTIEQPSKHFYWIRIVTIFLGKPLKHLYGHNPRLFRKGAGRWTDHYVHEQVARVSVPPRADRRSDPGVTVQPRNILRLGDSDSAVLRYSLLHHSHDTIASYMQKMHEYTSLDAQQMVQLRAHRSGRAVTARALLPYQLSLKQFAKLFVYKRGILDGWAGWVWCVLSAYYEWEMACKYNAKIKSQKSKLKLKT